MPGIRYDPESGTDEQDLAETFDESNVVDPESGGRPFEETSDVEDVTRRVGDSDDDAALALDAEDFDEDLMSQVEEPDNELDYEAATEEREDDLDGLGPEDMFDEDRIDELSEVEGIAREVGDAEAVPGGEDDFTNFQSKALDDDDLRRLGYSDKNDD